MNEFGLLFSLIVFWIVLNRWILPWFGIRTCCMSGGCATDRCSMGDAQSWPHGDKDVVQPKGNRQ